MHQRDPSEDPTQCQLHHWLLKRDYRCLIEHQHNLAEEEHTQRPVGISLGQPIFGPSPWSSERIDVPPPLHLLELPFQASLRQSESSPGLAGVKKDPMFDVPIESQRRMRED